jgi:hypothetical protein
MPFKIQVGPVQTSIHQGQTILVTESDGEIDWPSDKGLYFLDTRVLSNWNVYANGEPWTLLNGGGVHPREWTGLGRELDHLPGILLFERCRAPVSEGGVEPLAVIDLLDKARQ